jgi:hypothetical protein
MCNDQHTTGEVSGHVAAYLLSERVAAHLYSPNDLEKLSEKGYEQRSDRGFGPYTEAKISREGASQQPVGLSCERVRDFSDSFRRGILRSSRIRSVPLALFVSLHAPVRGGLDVGREQSVLISERLLKLLADESFRGVGLNTSCDLSTSRFAPKRFAPKRFAPWRFAPWRFVSCRSRGSGSLSG